MRWADFFKRFRPTIRKILIFWQKSKNLKTMYKCLKLAPKYSFRTLGSPHIVFHILWLLQGPILIDLHRSEKGSMSTIFRQKFNFLKKKFSWKPCYFSYHNTTPAIPMFWELEARQGAKILWCNRLIWKKIFKSLKCTVAHFLRWARMRAQHARAHLPHMCGRGARTRGARMRAQLGRLRVSRLCTATHTATAQAYRKL